MIHIKNYIQLNNEYKTLKRIKKDDYRFNKDKQNMLIEIGSILNDLDTSIKLNKSFIKECVLKLNNYLKECNYDSYCSRIEDEITDYNNEIEQLCNEIEGFRLLESKITNLQWGDKHE